MSKLTPLILLTFLIYTANAQVTFQKRLYHLESDVGYVINAVDDGGFIVAGVSSSPDTSGVILVKTNDVGNVEWSKIYSQGQYPKSVEQSSDGGFIVAGSCSQPGFLSDIYVLKTDNLGNIEWEKTYGGTEWDYGTYAGQADGNNFVVVGHSRTFGAGVYDYHFIKVNSDGDILLSKVYGRTGGEHTEHVSRTTDNSLMIIGDTQSNVQQGSNDGNMCMLKINMNGDVVWDRSFGAFGPGANEIGYGVAETADHGFIGVGYSDTINTSNFNTYIVRTNSIGDTLWTKSFDFGGGYDVARAVIQSADGGFALTGMVSTPSGSLTYLLKLDANSNIEWAKTYDRGSGYSLLQTDDLGFIITGLSEYGDFFPNSGISLIKTDANGNTDCSSEYLNIIESIVPSQVLSGLNVNNGMNQHTISSVIYDIDLADTTFCSNIVTSSPIVDTRNPRSGYPNPTNDRIQIDLGTTGNDVTINAYNLEGKLVQTQTQNTVGLFDYVMPKSKGVYLIQVGYLDGTVTTLKVVKE